MTDRSHIESVVMRRVRRITWLRLIISGGVFAVALALLALYGIGREVWVARVFANGPQDFIGHALYLVYAFEHTRFVVQGLVLVCLGSFLFLAREIARAVAVLSVPQGV
ncbi:MAG: hypothetical protein B7W98_02725 [Parcubacteria group bacterium 20-58-5]|nr:MAG: hypothetical protein B7W98_02725 [Parcubacteria group bacterium 20-58-5]OYV62942.1 MAG: hypothetical protein B7X03_03695 [Parcubacteria group bacterium 21-58-10]OYV83103.1 MAG: hypothetical protein B7W96_00705 [Parcubacteria group bacterium 37-58-5]